MRIMSFWRAIAQTLYGDSTRPIRFILALVEVLFVSYLLKMADSEQFDLMWTVTGAYAWSAGFLVHAGYLLYGLTGKYSTTSLFVEGLFGMCLWWVTAITNWVAQGVPGPTLACAIAMTIIWANYPTHKPWEDRDNG